MIKKERNEQLRYRLAMTSLIAFNVVCSIPFGTKVYDELLKPIGNIAVAIHETPMDGINVCKSNKKVTSGYTDYLSDLTQYAIANPIVKEEVVEIVSEKAPEKVELDISCWKKYSAKRFRKLGRVWYEGHTYTWYSEYVLPGGGLKIPDRHLEYIDGLAFVCDKDGYICVASDFLPHGVVVDTPVGRQGKIYDEGAGKNNLDLYVSW